MRNYSLDFSYSSSVGVQPKYYRNGYYYKINKSGDEGFTEYFCSRVLGCSDLPYVRYEYCTVNKRLGCRYRSFTDDCWEFVSMEELYHRTVGGSNLQNDLYALRSVDERKDFLCRLSGVSWFYGYLQKLLYWDLLVCNVDRHSRNYGLLVDVGGSSVKPAPVFDNGCCLDTDRSGRSCSKTVSGSLEQQIGIPSRGVVTLDMVRLNNVVNDTINKYGRRHEITVFLGRLHEYRSLFS